MYLNDTSDVANAARPSRSSSGTAYNSISVYDILMHNS
jgi:hypothetical protein